MNPQFFQPAPAKPSPNPTPLQPSQPLTNQSATNQPAQVAQTQPATMISRSDAETENHKKAADIARSEIDRILIGDDGSLRAADSELADEPTSGTMITPVASRIQPDVNPYNQTHSPTSDTANLHSDDQPAASASVLAQRQAYIAAHQKYHAAWQRYYQQYYERYYLAALENEKRKFQNQTASVKTGDGTLSQKEAVDELRAGLLGKIQSAGKKVKKSRHFWPAVAALCVILVAAFIQYNQLLFANISSFVSPGKISSDNIVIGTAGSDTVSADPLVIIPK
ncbi:MAG: hypothetical protein LBM73_00320, partial [Candidatus Nomurabacteria bacterium]|nr:hypothetical protein [Candidatus Nomurabacteria bacterium]